MNKDELEKVIGDIGKNAVNEVIGLSDKIASKVTRGMNGINQEYQEVLESMVGSDGTIPSYQLNALSKVSDGVESEYYTLIEDELTSAIERVIGEVVADVSGKMADIPLVEEIITPGLLEDVKEEAIETLYSREIDKATVTDRLKAMAAVIAMLVLKEAKYGVLVKESVTAINKRIRAVVNGNLWQIKRIVSSELLTSIRIAVVTLGAELGVIKGFKIIDNRGRHGGHHLHKCYEYAETDKYGLGKGVYKPSDTKVLDPHPQCTAYFVYEFKDGVFKEGADD